MVCSCCPECFELHTARWDDTDREVTHNWTDVSDWHLLEDELSVDVVAYEIVHIQRPSALEGMDFLWGCCLYARNDVVATKAHDMMLGLARHMPARDLFARLSDTLKKTPGPDCVRRCRQLQVAMISLKFDLLLWRPPVSWPSNLAWVARAKCRSQLHAFPAARCRCRLACTSACALDSIVVGWLCTVRRSSRHCIQSSLIATPLTAFLPAMDGDDESSSLPAVTAGLCLG